MQVVSTYFSCAFSAINRSVVVAGILDNRDKKRAHDLL